MNYIIQRKNDRDDIVIDVCPSLKCNYNCSYCFADIASCSPFVSDKFDIMLNAIPYDSSILFRLLGGEPTLIPSILDITQRIINTMNSVQIVTNGSLLHKIKFQKEVRIEISIHYEYIDDVYIERIIEGINNNKDNEITIVINVSSTLGSGNIDKIRRVVDAIKALNLPNVDFGLHPLVFNDGRDEIIDYDACMSEFGLYDVNLRMSHVYKLRNITDGTCCNISHIDYTNIYKLMGNDFSGCLCVNKYYDITYDFELSLDCGCTNAYKGSIIDNPSILTDICNEVVVCDLPYCFDGCYMDTTKHFKTELNLEEVCHAG